MSDWDRFDGLAEALEAADAARTSAEHDDVELATEPDETWDEPAFPFDATTPHSIYVRGDTLAAVDDVEALVDARLRTERDIRNLTTREFYEAVLQVAIEHPDSIIERVVANRTEAADR